MFVVTFSFFQIAEIIFGGKNSTNSYRYEIAISTCTVWNAGSSANVTINLAGENCSSGALQLGALTKAKPLRGSKLMFVVYLPERLGPLLYLHVWHDNTGESPAWYLNHVIVRDSQTTETWKFMCEDWLAVESNDGRVDKILYWSSNKDIWNYKQMFLSHSVDGLYDKHLWLSVVSKPPTSSFTRVQRAFCCLSLLFSTMITNAMFYNFSEESDTSAVIFIGPIKISARQLVIGIQSSLLIFPVNLLMTLLFRTSSSLTHSASRVASGKSRFTCRSTRFRSKASKSMRMKDKLKSKATRNPCNMTAINLGQYSHLKDEENPSRKMSSPRKPVCLTFLYYIAWTLCLVTVVSSTAFTMMYTLQWGNDISNKWLISFFVSFLQDALVSQPVKVALSSAVLAFILKIVQEQKSTWQIYTSNKKLNMIEKAPEVHTNYVAAPLEDDISQKNYLPPSQENLQKAKKKRLTEIQVSIILWNVAIYIIFLLVLLAVAYGHRDPVSHQLNEEIDDMFPLSVCIFSLLFIWE